MQEAAIAAGTLQPGITKDDKRYILSWREAMNALSANRSEQAMTRLARIAVLVQNSSVVGPSRRTANSATITPKTMRATLPSGTVLGSGIMNRAKIRISGDVTRISQSDLPQRGDRCQLATIQWSGTGASAIATKMAKEAMKAISMPRS